jgi:molybdopterin-guanine dinucleotide biosynthesis protein A
MLDVEGFILVGGASSRMGRDKATLSLGDEPIVLRLAGQLSGITTRVRTVGRPNGPDLQPTGLESIPDLHTRWGALGGIHTALDACQAEWAAIVACDLPFVTERLLSRLTEIASSDQSPNAVVPIQEDLRPQPLCALYRKSACVEPARQLIAAGEHTPRALLQAVNTKWVAFEEIKDLPNSRHLFLNVNTPADFEQAQHLFMGLNAAPRHKSR